MAYSIVAEELKRYHNVDTWEDKKSSFDTLPENIMNYYCKTHDHDESNHEMLLCYCHNKILSRLRYFEKTKGYILSDDVLVEAWMWANDAIRYYYNKREGGSNITAFAKQSAMRVNQFIDKQMKKPKEFTYGELSEADQRYYDHYNETIQEANAWEMLNE